MRTKRVPQGLLHRRCPTLRPLKIELTRLSFLWGQHVILFRIVYGRSMDSTQALTNQLHWMRADFWPFTCTIHSTFVVCVQIQLSLRRCCNTTIWPPLVQGAKVDNLCHVHAKLHCCCGASGLSDNRIATMITAGSMLDQMERARLRQFPGQLLIITATM